MIKLSLNLSLKIDRWLIEWFRDENADIMGVLTMYTMKELSTKVGKSQQAIYKLIKQNGELSTIIKENSTKEGRLIKYGEPVLEWLMGHYDADSVNVNDGEPAAARETDVEAVTDRTNRTQENNVGGSDSPSELEYREELILLRQENKMLREAVARLQSDIEKERAEKKALLEQNGIALLALREEQAEKQKYLPEPGKGWSFFRGLFSKKQP